MITPDSGTSAITFPPAFFKEFSEDYGDEVSCSDDDILNFGSLTFRLEYRDPLTDEVRLDDYNLPSHHWVKRTENDSDAKGGVCRM